MYRNPVIPGFYPDPSVCRRGDDYYLINSSFEYFPGVPIFHSTDLVRWEQIGYALDRPSQLDLNAAYSSEGIYAPTIRYARGRFYIVTTNASHGGNFIVSADDPQGPWSEPVFVRQGGIDPSLFFDDDGKTYLLSVGYDEKGQGIIISQINPDTGELIVPARMLWHGTGDRYPEGAHLYKLFGMYYLMIAEGGTEFTHSETIARCDTLMGDYQGCPNNPILTTRREPDPELCGVGHADLVEDGRGHWHMIFHGYRHSAMMFHHLGRETCLASVVWREGWPVVNDEKPVRLLMEEELPELPRLDNEFCDGLTVFRPQWCYLRNPNMDCYRFSDQGLTLRGGGGLSRRISPTLYLLRQTAFATTFSVSMEALSLDEGAQCGITVFYNDSAHYDFYLTWENDAYWLCLRKHVGDMEFVSSRILWRGSSAALRVEATKSGYTFYGDQTVVGTALTIYVSTEATPHSYTGVMLGLFATGDAAARFWDARRLNSD